MERMTPRDRILVVVELSNAACRANEAGLHNLAGELYDLVCNLVGSFLRVEETPDN